VTTLWAGMLLAHLLYDFHWQGDFIASMKGKNRFILGVHALTWAMLLTAVLWHFGQATWMRFAFLFVTHFFTDRWKSRLPKTPEWFWAIYVDQAIHLISIMTVVMA
jgi:predicted membrane protein